VDLPGPWTFLLLTLAAWRIWHLLAEDELLNRVRDRVAPPSTKRREWIECPYCGGAWIGGAVWLSWTLWPDFSSWFASLWAILAVVVFIQITINIATDR
jgi:hypothetical protein